jgi:hypothetical protein
MNLQKNDLIELNYGSNSIELAKIISINKSTVEALNLSNLNKIIFSLDELYLKEEITSQRMCPKYEEQMKMLGAKNLWVRLTKIQYKKINKNFKEKSEPIKEIDDKQIESLKKWFLENKDEEKKEKTVDIFNLKVEEEINSNSINIFGDKDKEKTSPLSRFIKKI